MPHSRPVLVSAAAAILAGCGGGGIESGGGSTGSTIPAVSSGGSDCSATRLKQTVLDTAREWYLFPELLPANVDLSQFATPDALLESITGTARAQSRDRFFSYLTGIAAENALLQGTTAGFGLTLLERRAPSRLLVGQVFEGSVAAENGFARGDEILAIGTAAGSLQSIEQLAMSSDGVTQALGPSTAGTARVLRWRSAATGAIVERSVTKRAFELNAVPASSVRVFTTAGGTRVGHLTLRSFVADPSTSGGADLAALRSAFASFASQNITHLIIDLRYNGGGLVSIAELLLNLLAGDQAGQVSYATRLNSRQAAQQETRRFTRQPQTLPTVRVAFLTTDRSASASELVINSAAPYVRTAIIGSRTFGKPVGQYAFDVTTCDFRLRLVAFKSVNRNEDGDYFSGLPDTGLARTGASACVAEDDVSRPLADPQERMTAEALAWLASPTGACSVGAIADTPATAGVAESSGKVATPRPGLGESGDLPGVHPWLPGTY